GVPTNKARKRLERVFVLRGVDRLHRFRGRWRRFASGEGRWSVGRSGGTRLDGRLSKRDRALFDRIGRSGRNRIGNSVNFGDARKAQPLRPRRSARQGRKLRETWDTSSRHSFAILHHLQRQLLPLGG